MRWNTTSGDDFYANDPDYYDNDQDFYATSSYCSRFTRRGDMTVFNMSDYQSCENCRHMTADNQCLLKMQGQFTSSR